jgi:membrane protein DedA with SNARE-associated domain
VSAACRRAEATAERISRKYNKNVFYAGGWLTAAGILSYIDLYILGKCFNQRFLRKMLAAAFYRIDSILHAERNVP